MSYESTRNPLSAIGRRNALLVALGVPLAFGQCQAEPGPRTSVPPPSSRLASEEDDGAEGEEGMAAQP